MPPLCPGCGGPRPDGACPTCGLDPPLHWHQRPAPATAAAWALTAAGVGVLGLRLLLLASATHWPWPLDWLARATGATFAALGGLAATVLWMHRARRGQPAYTARRKTPDIEFVRAEAFGEDDAWGERTVVRRLFADLRPGAGTADADDLRVSTAQANLLDEVEALQAADHLIVTLRDTLRWRRAPLVQEHRRTVCVARADDLPVDEHGPDATRSAALLQRVGPDGDLAPLFAAAAGDPTTAPRTTFARTVATVLQTPTT